MAAKTNDKKNFNKGSAKLKDKQGKKDDASNITNTTNTPKSDASRKARKKIRLSGISILGNVLFMLSIVLALLLATFMQQPVAWCSGTEGDLLGEELLDSHEKARNYADRAVAEAYALMQEPASNWQIFYNTSANSQNNNPQLQLTVECRRVTEGPFANSTNHLSRAVGILRNVTAQEAFDFMVSPAGFQVIDPASDPVDFEKSIEKIPDWRGRTEIAEAYAPLPLMAERQFVVLNSFLPEERMFVSKSVLHKSRPGASSFYQGTNNVGDLGGNKVRAINTFAIKVDPIRLEDGEEAVQVSMINYIDLILHQSLMSYLSCYGFFPGLYNNFQDVFNEKGHIIKT